VALDDALEFAGEQRSSSVVILYRGRILAERHWEMPPHQNPERAKRYRDRRAGADSEGRAVEDVASVQKSVVAILAAIASDRGLLDFHKPVSSYLGRGWSKSKPESETLIEARHVMSMTSGLSTTLEYKAHPGELWEYNTAAYVRVREILEGISGKQINELTKDWLTTPLGMRASRWWTRPWATRANALGFTTTARDLARLGLLALAGGRWKDQRVVQRSSLDTLFAPSQDVNPSYGLLWWVNGQKTCHLPFSEPRKGHYVSLAPADMFGARGGLGRRLYVVPSLGIVITRLGDQPPVEDRLGVTGFDEEFWSRLAAAFPRVARHDREED
jgi:CubicO group peptidase (beta-lactamase class C family)